MASRVRMELDELMDLGADVSMSSPLRLRRSMQRWLMWIYPKAPVTRDSKQLCGSSDLMSYSAAISY